MAHAIEFSGALMSKTSSSPNEWSGLLDETSIILDQSSIDTSDFSRRPRGAAVTTSAD
jgi:hypothetical protein